MMFTSSDVKGYRAKISMLILIFKFGKVDKDYRT